MNVPDADLPPEHVPASPEALASGGRMLAAIVFTDTVGFSAIMRKDEERAMRLIARDLETMKATCGSFGGQVLKSTGDGLLMLFTSAVQAVACALEIQREFHKQNLERPKDERLRHRIGIHLGDVFQNAGDVMGDGVNIAARLQTEAVPGGICLSQTVYDVVHNRLPFYVNHLGARTLKNIGRVNAYQVSPTAEGPYYIGILMSWARPVGLSALVIILAVAIGYAISHESAKRQKHVDEELAAMAGQLDPRGDVPKAVVVPSSDQGSGKADLGVASAYPEKGKIAATDEDFEIARFNYMNKYNFGAMIDWLDKYDAPSTDEDKLGEVCKSIRDLFGWSMTELQNYTAARPLVMHTDADGHPHVCWRNVSGDFMLQAGDNPPITLPREQVPPATFADIVAALIRENAKPGQQSTLQLWRGVRFFVETYHVKPSPVLQKDLDDAAAQDYAATASVTP
jgi:class 3 adenylate cyclase